MSYAKTRLETSKPRSLSISDTSKLDAALASLKVDTPQGKSDGIHVQELSGVWVKRVPLVEANFEDNTTIPSYQYHVENKRDYDVRIVMAFTGENFKVSPANGLFNQPTANSVEGVIQKGQNQAFSLIDAANKSKDFTFSTDIKIYPIHDDIRETELEGVKLFTTIAYSGMTGIMVFEALNNKEFDVEVELNLKGDFKEVIGSLPFQRVVRVGQRVELGRIKSDGEVETSWKWTGVTGETPAPLKGHVQTSELKGVTLKQTLTPGTPTVIQFDVTNGRDKRIKVEIDLNGEGEVDFKGQSRPLTGSVAAGATTFIGTVAIKGDAEVNWKFQEEANY